MFSRGTLAGENGRLRCAVVDLSAADARLTLLATAASERDITAGLQISHRTVHKHLQRSYRPLAVANPPQAAAIAWGATVKSDVVV